MLGKNTNVYKSWIKEKERYLSMSPHLDVINFGSSCDANNFDYRLWSATGFNFASAPQDIYYDNQLLHQYGNRVNPGGIVFISLSEFALVVDKYDIEDHNYKYYWYLDSERIPNYSSQKHKMLVTCPGFLDNKYLKLELKDFVKRMLKWDRKRGQRKEIGLEEQSVKMLNNWFSEFGWNNGCDLRDEQKQSIERSWGMIQEDIEFCKRNGLFPIIVIPPFCSFLINLMPSEIIDECLWKYIRKLENDGIKVISFWNDKELQKPEYYSTPILLNETGKKIFNRKLQEVVMELTNKNYYMESEEEQQIFSYELSNKVKTPCIAFGTGVIKRYYRNKKMYFKDTLKDILRSIKHMKLNRRLKNDITINDTLNRAIENGYRMFDTGRLYGHSEQAIGRAISRQNRQDFFLVTKVSEDDLNRYANATTVHDNLMMSLHFLKTDYVDAYLLHFPSGDWISTYKEIEKEYISGYAKAIGVCNFDVQELQQLMKEIKIKPMICQVELNPLNTKKELVDFCKENGIVLMAHTPTAHMDPRVVKSDIFQKLMSKYNKSAAQIIYRWHYQNSIIPIVSSVSNSHMKENLSIFDFNLLDSEMKEIDNLNQGVSFDKNNNKVNDCPAFVYNL